MTNAQSIKNYATQFIGKNVAIKINRPINSKHPKHDFLYKVNYGFVPETIAPDGEEIDAYVLGVDEPITDFEGKCVAIIHRLNDDDDKLIIVTPALETITDDEIRKFTNFQEQFFTSQIIRKESSLK